MRDGDQARAGVQELFKFLQDQLAPVVDRGHAQDGILLVAQHLPGNDVGVMLHGGDQDFVAGLHVLPAVGLRDQVDALRGPAHEDDLPRIGGVQESLDLDPRAFVRFRGALA